MVYVDTYGGRTAVVLEAQHVQLGDCVIHIAHLLISELGAMEISKNSEDPMDHYVPASTGAVFFLNITGETGQLQFQSSPDIQGHPGTIFSTMAPGSVGRCQKGSEVREPNEGQIPFDPKKSAGTKHEKPTVNMMENPISFVVAMFNSYVRLLEAIEVWPCCLLMITHFSF